MMFQAVAFQALTFLSPLVSALLATSHSESAYQSHTEPPENSFYVLLSNS